VAIVGVELWDAPVAGKLLQEWRDDESFPERVAEVVAARFAGVPRVHLAGGGATDAIREAIVRRGHACTMSTDPFEAARAGAARAGACADVGQTSIKLVIGAGEGRRERRIPRDFQLAPFRDAVSLGEREAARTSTIATLAQCLAEIPPQIRGVLVGLPCEIRDGIPRSCSYCWRDPDPDLVADLARAITAYAPRADSAAVDVAIVNDAVLAAMAVSSVTRPVAVITIGFGVGAALVEP